MTPPATCKPRSIIWSDGRAFPIEQVRDFRPASSQEDGRDRYTVIIRGQEKYLFFERTDPRFAGEVWPVVCGGVSNRVIRRAPARRKEKGGTPHGRREREALYCHRPE